MVGGCKLRSGRGRLLGAGFFFSLLAVVVYSCGWWGDGGNGGGGWCYCVGFCDGFLLENSHLVLQMLYLREF